jgi:hypothetical protein
MARFNTGARTLTVTGTTTLTYAFTGGIITLDGAGGYTFSLVTPVFFPGTTQHIYNATAVDCTIATPVGQLRGNGFTGNNVQTIPSGSFYSVVSDGANYIISNSEGGPEVGTVGTFTTSITSPIHQGSTSAAGTLTLRSTSSGTKSTAGILMNDGITSSNTTTGTLAVTGGVGISENLNVGGIIIAASLQNTAIGSTTRSSGAFTSLAANAQVSLTAGTASTSTGSGTLVVTGGVGVSGNLYTGGIVDITSTQAASSTTSGALQVDGGAGIQGALYAGSIQNTPIGSSAANTGAFTSLNANAAVRLTQNAGSTSTADGTLVVTGGAGITQNLYVGGVMRVNDGTASGATSTGALVVSGGIGAGGTSYFPTLVCSSLTETSSIELKENINPIFNALDLILKLEGVTYDRKDGSYKNEAGLIAEHVNKILPNLVKKDADGNPESIMYSKLTAYLVEAVKSLKSEIEELKRN